MDIAPGDPFRDRSEPRSITIGDLAALIAGIALVLALPTTQTYWPLPSDFLGPWPRWFPWARCLRQALGAACVALVPVVFWRRACYGGLARYAEFLVLCAAMPFLDDSVETALIRANLQFRTGQSPPGFGLQGMPTAFVKEWRDSSHWSWERAILLTGAFTLAMFFLGRRKLPGWLLSACLILAWLAAYEAGPQLARRWLYRAIAHVNGRPIGATAGVLISSAVYQLPRFVLYIVPAVAAVRDLRRDRRIRLSYLEWAGLGMTAALFLVAEITEAVRYYSITRGAGQWALETLMRAGTLLTALLLGLLLNRTGKADRSRNAGGSSREDSGKGDGGREVMGRRAGQRDGSG
jgi:hypothetical protein